ncbi:GTPase-like protein [Methanococcus vannielii SB]|jgi:ribosome-binding ATPase YchF (GTP1/OBG family)|uniref:GTPase-like protein n=1 Tax=Methanococcus vannielii (strain ATCC 35089 / DSM 1224 / JCM 13029 / OCM 148 / SB) TaxID=406327 RepID=A6UPD0_METVS|nr:redox-regulated ATPase YchF [Methanococcus vannielii]ABR54352.1 GTPase-like protein [Methanococcus vannielii SB]
MAILGLVGKPNVGKSTTFNAMTEKVADVGNYPFTTINPNIGTSFVTKPCPCSTLNLKCSPNNSKCFSGVRNIPVEIIDVAGLVPDAHKGKGMGNKFLDDLRQADAFILVVDASGKTDLEGNITEDHDPIMDVKFLLNELDMWIYGILTKNWERLSRRAQQEKNVLKSIHEQLSGLNISENQVAAALRNLDESPMKWTESDILTLSTNLRKASKPMIIAANKADHENAEKNIEKLKEEFKEFSVIPTSSEIELALKKAEKAGLINYNGKKMEIIDETRLNDAQKNALNYMKNYLEKFGGTGIQNLINNAYFDLLNMIVVYPVEDEGKFSDKKGNVLPDAYLLKKGSTARELAFKIHTEIGQKFIYAVDARKKLRIGADQELNDGDIIKIVSAA